MQIILSIVSGTLETLGAEEMEGGFIFVLFFFLLMCLTAVQVVISLTLSFTLTRAHLAFIRHWAGFCVTSDLHVLKGGPLP